jgi:hypothetical protein
VDVGSKQTTEQRSPITLHNHCPVTLHYGQVGTDECIELPSGASSSYTWHSAPGLHPGTKRLLRICGSQRRLNKSASSSEGHLQRDSRDSSGKVGSIPGQQTSDQHGQVSMASKETGWAQPFEAMAHCASIVSLQLSSGLCTFVAVSTVQVICSILVVGLMWASSGEYLSQIYSLP